LLSADVDDPARFDPGRARAARRRTCYAALEQALVDELVATKHDPKQRPLHLVNACLVLKRHVTLTILKKKNCT
jgi:hypothetical protein